jgi:hypothetical protein
VTLRGEGRCVQMMFRRSSLNAKVIESAKRTGVDMNGKRKGGGVRSKQNKFKKVYTKF